MFVIVCFAATKFEAQQAVVGPKPSFASFYQLANLNEKFIRLRVNNSTLSLSISSISH